MTFALALLAGSAPLLALVTLQAAAGPSEASSPPRRAHHALVYDAKGERVLLAGGSTPLEDGDTSGFFNDLWAFDGARWTSLGESGIEMSCMRLAADAKGRIHSFGGFTGSPLGALRVLEGDVWKALGDHPEILAGEPGFVFDSQRNCFVVFGGPCSPGETLADTWEFDGRDWRRAEVASPPARDGHAMAFDAKRGRTVVFGGVGKPREEGPRAPMSDTWEFDGTTWTEREVRGPSPRSGAGIAYDSKRARTILFGGRGQGVFLGDTWSWDGTAWTLLASDGPKARGMGYLAYDEKRDRVVLFGGRNGWPNGDFDDTWEFDGSEWSPFSE